MIFGSEAYLSVHYLFQGFPCCETNYMQDESEGIVQNAVMRMKERKDREKFARQWIRHRTANVNEYSQTPCSFLFRDFYQI